MLLPHGQHSLLMFKVNKETVLLNAQAIYHIKKIKLLLQFVHYKFFYPRPFCKCEWQKFVSSSQYDQFQ